MGSHRVAWFAPAVVVVLAACTGSTTVSTSDTIAPLTTDPPARIGAGSSAISTLPIIPNPTGIGTAPVTVPGPRLPVAVAPGGGVPVAPPVTEDPSTTTPPPVGSEGTDPSAPTSSSPASVAPSTTPPPPSSSSAGAPPSSPRAPTTSAAGGPAAAGVPQEQVIVFDPIEVGWVYGETRAVVVRATSGLPVALSTTGSCAVLDAAAGVVVATDVGFCRVTARQPGDDRWEPAPDVSRRSTIGRAPTLVQPQPDLVFEYLQAPMTIALTATSTSDGSLAYRLLDDAAGACALSGSTLSFRPVAALPAACVVEADVPATDRFLAGRAAMTIEFTPTVVTIVAVSTTVAPGGDSVTIRVTTDRPWPVELVPVDGACAAAGSSALEALDHELVVALLSTPCTVRITPHLADGTAVGRARDVVISAPPPPPELTPPEPGPA